jgi:predicted TIM-barrel fold metal-dependent hydrolase
MSATLLEPAAAVRARIGAIDCDVHHALKSPRDLYPFMPARWRTHYETFGTSHGNPYTGTTPYPKATPALSRKDSWPPAGGPPGSDLPFLREQLLDRYGIAFGMLHILYPHADQRNQDFSAVICRAINEWQAATWTSQEKRLKAAIAVPAEDARAAVAEIERWAGNPDFVQVSLITHAIEPLGRRRYWPIYEAAAHHGLPIGLHSSGFNGHAVTPAGWPSFYVEEHHAVAISQQDVVTSFAFEGVLARLPSLKVVIIEAGFAWVPALCWRMDRHWARMRAELPHVPRPPSEYVREQMWFTTQPMDEPERPEDLVDLVGWLGWDRLLFATDYPHWDFDDPETAFKLPMTDAQRLRVFRDNARAVYRLD